MAGEKTELLQGTLDLIVLKLLRAGPANGGISPSPSRSSPRARST